METPKTPLKRVIEQFEQRNGSPFVPTRQLFYDRVGINQKRFGMLVSGKLPMYGYEAVALAEFFGVSPNDVMDYEPKAKSRNPQRVAIAA